MSELEILKNLSSLGVGGVLGIVIFLMYRRDRRDTEKRWRDMTEDLIASRDRETESRDNNTAATTELAILMKKLNGKVTKILER